MRMTNGEFEAMQRAICRVYTDTVNRERGEVDACSRSGHKLCTKAAKEALRDMKRAGER